MTPGIAPPPDEEYTACLVLWLRHYVETERYDRTLPGYWIRPGEWMPAGDAMRLSRAFADLAHRRLREEADRLGLLRSEKFRRAREHARCWAHEEQHALLRRLEESPAARFSAARVRTWTRCRECDVVMSRPAKGGFTSCATRALEHPEHQEHPLSRLEVCRGCLLGRETPEREHAEWCPVRGI